MKAVLEANVPDCKVTGEATPTTSGAFEVEDRALGKKYWSKLGGQGYLDNNKEALGQVIAAIKADGAAPAAAEATA